MLLVVRGVASDMSRKHRKSVAVGGYRVRERVLRLGAVVGGSTLGLTMGFFGLIALLTGDAAGALDRLPLYVFGFAATFVGTLVTFEDRRSDAETVLRAASVTAAANFVLVVFASEGLVYALRYPGEVVSSKLFVYVLSAGMIATGLGFWLANHYDEVEFAPRSGL